MTRLASTSKYHNRRVRYEGYTFDSIRECEHYKELRLREAAGEIFGLEVHRRFPLYAYDFRSNTAVQISVYEADFTYWKKGENPETDWPVVEDVKGYRTQMYMLKWRWLQAQYGVHIQEV